MNKSLFVYRATLGSALTMLLCASLYVYPVDLIRSVAQVQELAEKNNYIMVRFSNSQCSSCGLHNRIFAAIAQQFSATVKFGNVVVKDTPEVGQHFEIRSIPTFIFFKNGVEVGRAAGRLSAGQFVALIKQYFDV